MCKAGGCFWVGKMICIWTHTTLVSSKEVDEGFGINVAGRHGMDFLLASGL